MEKRAILVDGKEAVSCRKEWLCTQLKNLWNMIILKVYKTFNILMLILYVNGIVKYVTEILFIDTVVLIGSSIYFANGKTHL